jgi:hypothetical protein
MRSNIHNARHAVAELRATLLSPSPEGLASHVPALEAAVRDLEALGSGQDFVPRREIELFAVDLLGVARLIEHGMIFNQGWARVLAAAGSNYQLDGEPAPLEPAGKISVRG